MAGRIRDEDIALVRERSPVEEVVGEQVALRNAGGGSMKGLCPFHDERSPSFHVTPARGLWYCFGCGEGGDVIRFVEKVDGVGFTEAVERLAARAGVQLRYVEGGSAPIRQRGERSRLLEANAAAQEFYAGQLAGVEAGPAREYLTGRGFDSDAVARFGCGFAPAGWDALTRHLLGRGFSQRELITVGLSRESRRGGVIDRFHRRLLWPIRDTSGDVLGFGARRLFDDDPIEAKYLNTPETPVYKKGQVLYGMDLARRDIARRHQAVVVEGYTDVMACHLAGVPTAVATCGTALGAEHIGVLRRLLMDSDEFGGEVIFTFDGDEAGQRAALRAFADDQRFVMQTFVAVEPGGLDPCELRQARGDAAVRDLVARRQPLFAFALRAVLSRYDLDTAEGRVRALDRAAPLVARIKDRSLRPEYARRLAGDLGMEVEPVLARVAELVRADRSGGGRPATASRPAGGAERSAGGRADGRPDPEDPRLRVEREALKLAVQVPVLAGPLFDAADEDTFTHPAYRAIRHAIAEAGGVAAAPGGPAWVERITDGLGDLLLRSMVAELAVERLRTAVEADARYVAEMLARLREMALARQVADLKGRLQRINPLEQPDEHTRLFGELIALEQFKRGLREQAMGET
ncbi:MAG TPA: DNA primase [Mycobacteriales bacterium]|nr:DNA primase [Mycobacteriales bacterium]